MSIASCRPQSYYWRRAIRAAESAGDRLTLWRLAEVIAGEVDAHEAFIVEKFGPVTFLDPQGETTPAELCELLVRALVARKAFIRARGWWPPKGVWAPGELGEKMKAAV